MPGPISHNRRWLLAAAGASAMVCALWPSVARALPDRCHVGTTVDVSTRPPTFRATAARFAPNVSVRVWFHVDTHDNQRGRAPVIHQLGLSNDVPPTPTPTTTPVPVRRSYYDDRPFGWQFNLSWDLAEITDAFISDPDEAMLGRRAPGCDSVDRRHIDPDDLIDSGDLP